MLQNSSLSSHSLKKEALPSLELLVMSLLGIKIDKYFRRADWRIRPLPKAMLSYARTDSHYLAHLYTNLSCKLNEDHANNSSSSENKLVLTAIECNDLCLRRVQKSNHGKIKLILSSDINVN